MAWVAFDRAVKRVERFGLTGPLDRWRRLRDEIHGDLRARVRRRAQLVRAVLRLDELDASVLLIPLVGFLPADDPRVLGTVDAIEQRPAARRLRERYRHGARRRGRPAGGRRSVPALLVLAGRLLALMGRQDEARALFERLLALRNDVGLLVRGVRPGRKRLLGNFPQAFTHVGLVNSAYNLSHQAGPAEQRTES